jgi:hypothetical protein
MFTQLITMLIRRLLFLVLGNAAISALLGPELVEYLGADNVVTGIAAAVGALGLLLWSGREKIIGRVRLKFAAASQPTTVNDVKAEVAQLPVSAAVATAFTTERVLHASGAVVEKVVKE